MFYLIMARINGERIWPTVCYTCPTRISTPDRPACDERNLGMLNSNGNERNRPLYCPNGNGEVNVSDIKDIIRNNGRM